MGTANNHKTAMQAREFLVRFRTVLLAVCFLPMPAFLLIIGLAGGYAFTDVLNALKIYLIPSTLVAASGLMVLNAHMRQASQLAERRDDEARAAADQKVSQFPKRFGAFFALLALAGPVMATMCLAMVTGTEVTKATLLFALVCGLPTNAVLALLALYVFSDLVGQYFGPIGLRTHFLSLRIKVMALGVVMPFVVATVVILYFNQKHGSLSQEVFLLWAGLLGLCVLVAYLAQASLVQSFNPLQKLCSQALESLDDLDAIIDPVSVSLDEFGDLTRDWATLTHRMTGFWRKLQGTSSQYETMINAIEDAIAVVDRNTNTLFLGPGFADWLDEAPDAFVGRPLLDLVHADDLEQVRYLAAAAISSPDERPEGQIRLRHRDGTYHKVISSWRCIKRTDGDALFVTLKDVSQQLRAQERLRAGEIRLRTMMESVADGILSVDEQGIIQMVNPAAAELFGYGRDELIGNSINLLLHPALVWSLGRQMHRQASALNIEQLVGKGPYELKAQRKDNSSVPIEMAVTEMRIADERFFVGIVRDISARKQAEISLRAALDKAEAANRTKSLFLANMSHELRTPLNAVIGFSEVMKNEMFGPVENERYADYIGNIHDSSRHLLAVINDILDISRIESGELELEEDWTDLGDILLWAKDRAVSAARIEHASVTLDLPADLPEIHVDLRAFRQIVINLLSNALKFTPADGTIRLTAYRDELAGMAIEVTDTGIGIPAGQIETMMQPFTQSDNSLARRFEGTGLGLAITRSLVQAHGGRLEIESEEGHGTKALVRLAEARVMKDQLLLSNGQAQIA